MQHEADPSARPEQPPDSSSVVNRGGIQLPPFSPEKPAIWFAQLEGQFALSNITQDATKFYYVISHLDNKYAAQGEYFRILYTLSLHYDLPISYVDSEKVACAW
jgi:hypothetical protein